MWRDYNKKKHLYLDRSVLWWWYFWGIYFSLHSKMRNESHWWSIQNERTPIFFFIWFNRNEIHQIDTFMRECETFNNLCNHFIHVAFESRQVIIKIKMLTITFARKSCGALNIKLFLEILSICLFFYEFCENKQRSCPVCMQLPSFDIIKTFVHSLNNHTRFHFFFIFIFNILFIFVSGSIVFFWFDPFVTHCSSFAPQKTVYTF